MNLVRRVHVLEVRAGGLARAAAPAVPFDTPAAVLAVLAEQVNAVRADPFADPGDKARTVGLLAGVALRAIEARDVAGRLEAVERVLKIRREQQREREGRR